MSRRWAGTDCGKTHHHTLVLDAEGETLLSRRVANDEPELLKLVGDVLDLAEGRDVTWALDMAGGGPGLLLLLTGYQAPAAIRRTGLRRLTTWLRNRKARNAEALATKAVTAAERQHTGVTGETAIAKTVRTLTKEVMALNEKLAETDELIEGRFREHELAEGKRHVQAVLALARRRVNALWALIRDRRCYQVTPPVTTAT